ncbi:MAG TPA: amidase domain-containing protein [Bacillota bacterium]|nr:amidase domain-containing protein [Bacillota bacterium]
MQKIITKWERFFQNEHVIDTWWKRKKALFQKRHAKIVRINARGKVYRVYQSKDFFSYEYFLHISLLIREQNKVMSIEEKIIPYLVKEQKNKIVEHKQINNRENNITIDTLQSVPHLFHDNESYSRLAAVRYAERWWSSINPIFSKEKHNSFSFIYQCLLAGFSQTALLEQQTKDLGTLDDFTTYLGKIKGQEVTSPKQLRLGDIILYDFSGENKWDHATIVTAKDSQRMPLVNTQFTNCRYRYWSYEDSLMWTTKTAYKFLRIR